MPRTEAVEEYAKALKLGQKEVRERKAAGLDPHPQVLAQNARDAADSSVYVGLVEIPADRIVGTKTEGRVSAFSASFYPLLEPESEFANKWIGLCYAHLAEDGIREPIVCYEYLGDFYVQEGNKRVSVLKTFGAARIPGLVHRVMPQDCDPVRLKAYNEFLEFYKYSKVYDLKFTQPGGYAKILEALQMAPDQKWEETDRRRFRAYLQYFREAFEACGGRSLNVSLGEALLSFLEVHTYADLGRFSGTELKKELTKMWSNIKALEKPEPEVSTAPADESSGSLLQRFKSPDDVKCAFIHQRTAAASTWTGAHETGRRHLEEALGRHVETVAYFNANSADLVEQYLEQAVAEGADIIFTTTPQMIGPSLKASVKYPKVKILNCSVDMPYSTVRTYYSRIYESKFITGAIAGALAKNDRIGYVATYPIHGEPASINAFALGAQLTNPRAKIELKWSCQKGNPTQEFLKSGIRVISNRDTPVEDKLVYEFGTYIYNEDGRQTALGSPVWLWGKFYEKVVRSVLAGSWETKPDRAVNYWWGMSSGVIDVKLSDQLPDGVASLAKMLREGLRRGMIDPFCRKITAQDGTLKNDGSRGLTPEELLHMDWLCENVRGTIPTLEEILPMSQGVVKLLGIHPEERETKV